MFTLVTLVLMGLVAADLLAAITRYPELFKGLVPLLRADPASRRTFLAGRIIDGMAHLWLLALTLPLKGLDESAALAWAVLVTIGACDSVHTARTIEAAVEAPEQPPTPAMLISWPYRLWRVCYDVVILAGCGSLLAAG